MARQGRAGVALALAAIGSFMAGCAATLVVGAFASPLGRVALLFGAQEYFSLIFLGLMLAIVLAGGSLLRALISVLIGVVMAGVGTDVETGVQRMTFGHLSLLEGFNVSVVAMGIFSVGEILRNLGGDNRAPTVQSKLGRLWPSGDEMRRSLFPTLRGTVLGSALGLLPGSGTLLAPFASYALEKRLSRTPERFGNGAVEGVAGPEAANNAAAQTGFIPLLALGLPPNAVMALMLGALTIQGIAPGPDVLTKYPNLFWGLVASMWIGNLMLLIINLLLIGMWVSLLRVPYRLLFPAILLFCCIGQFSVNRQPADIFFMTAFGLFGLGLVKLGFEPAPLLLGFVLGDLLEANFRRAMILSRNDWTTFFRSPISVTFLMMAALLLVSVLVPAMQRTRDLAASAD
jgi:putative tricarboxylic transport membrane protein